MVRVRVCDTRGPGKYEHITHYNNITITIRAQRDPLTPGWVWAWAMIDRDWEQVTERENHNNRERERKRGQQSVYNKLTLIQAEPNRKLIGST